MWHVRALKWSGWSGGTLLLFVLLVTLLVGWAGKVYTRYHPLDLTAQLPKVEKYVMPKGVGLTADKAELYFDDGPIVRVSGLAVRGTDGQMAVYVEQAAVKFATTQMLLLSAAPKVIEASGVTLRVVRGVDGVSIAGLNLGKDSSATGVVDWLNGLGWDRVWGRLKGLKVANLNLLVRDDVTHAEWVLEDGNLNASRYPDEGEKGTLTAFVRRLYGDDPLTKQLDNVPVLVSFAHGPKADGMEIRGRLDNADARMVTDYFPPQFKDLLKAKGQVEVGTQLKAGNKLDQPWVTLRLDNVVVQPDETAFSKALKFPKMVLTASYTPPTAGVSGSDVLDIKDLQVTTSRGAVVAASGTITGLQAPTGKGPYVDVRLASGEGEVQGIFDFFPDKVQSMAKALHWLRPNLPKGDYANLTAHYAGYPSVFPHCGNACGVLEIDGAFTNGRVRFLDELTPADVPAGVLSWRGQALTVVAPSGTIAADAGVEKATDIVVKLEDIFEAGPTYVKVALHLQGPAKGIVQELDKMPETQGKIPQGVTGRVDGGLDITVPLPHGVTPSFALSTVLVSATVADARITGLDELKGLDFAAPRAVVTLDADKRLRVVGDGLLGVNPMAADWSMVVQPKAPNATRLTAKGTVTGDWLMKQVSTTQASVDGLVGVSLTAVEAADGTMNFAAHADAARATVAVPPAKYTKVASTALQVDVRGAYKDEQGKLVKLDLDKLDVQGKDVALAGNLTWVPDNWKALTADFARAKVGDTDISIRMAKGAVAVSGSVLDLRGYDVFGDESDDTPDTTLDGVTVKADVGKVMFKDGDMTGLKLAAANSKGVWDVNSVHALVDNGRVDVTKVPLAGQAGRSKMTLAVDNLGKVLAVTGLYADMEKGTLRGEITYDSPKVGGGVVTMTDFVLNNPSLLVRILSLMSLDQILAGTTSTMFSKATVPLRVDGSRWYLDNANFEGPSMGVRLTGSYDRKAHEINMDGKMAPSIPLNRLVAKIPVLGTILTGSQDGLVVADFKVKGTTDDPQVNVRPLSVLTPGLVKDVWHGLTGDDANKVKPKVQRDGK